MTEKVYMSASAHKRLDVQMRLAQYGQTVLFASPPPFTVEPDIPTPMSAPIKTWSFLQNESVVKQIQSLGDFAIYWAFTMDVGGFIPGKDLTQTEMLTTCRGLVPSVEKTSETATKLYDQRKQDRGIIIFDNTCSPIKIVNGRPVDWRGYVSRSELGLSMNLMRMMADGRIWRKILGASEALPLLRPLSNEGSTGGIDWSVLPHYLSLIHQTSGVRDLDVVWKNQYGKKWIANENGIQKGMTQEMSRHLRGFPLATIRGLASLPN